MTIPVEPPTAPRSPFRRRIVVGLLMVAGLLGGLVALAPMVLSSPAVFNRVLARATQDLDGTITVGKATLGWFTPTELTDVTVTDRAGQPVLTTPRIRLDRTALQLVRAPKSLGTVRVDEPTVSCTITAGKLNLESILKRPDAPPPDIAPPPAVGPSSPPEFRVEVVGGTVVVRDTDTGGEWSARDVTLTVDHPSDLVKPLTVTVAGTVQATGETSPVSADLSVPRGPDCEGTCEARFERLPLAAVRPLLARFDPDARLEGTASGTIKARFAGSMLELETTLVGTGVTIAAPHYLADEVQLARLDAPLKARLQGRVLTIESAKATTDFGTASAVGTVDLDNPLQARLDSALDVDLARLAAIVPKTLAVRAGTRITHGRLVATTRTEGDRWSGRITTTGLRAVADGKTIEWAEPIELKATVRRAADGWPVVEELRGGSDFLTVAGTGTDTAITGTVTLDLDRMTARLGQVVDLGPTRFGGRGEWRLDAHRTDGGRFVASADGAVHNLVIVSGQAAPIREPLLAMRAEVQGLLTSGAAPVWGAMNVRVAAGGEEVTVATSGQAGAPMRLTARGDLARWQQRWAGLAPLPAGWSVAGPMEAAGLVRTTPSGAEVSEAVLTVRGLRLDGPGWAIREPAFEVKTAGIWATADKTLSLTDTQARATAFAVNAPTIRLTPDGASAKLTVRGDLERLSAWEQPPPAPGQATTGDLTAAIEWFSTGALSIDATVKDYAAGPSLREPELRLQTAMRFDTARDVVHFDRLKVSGRSFGLACDATGRVEQWSGRRNAHLSGRIAYDLDRLLTATAPDLKPSITLRGQGERPFRLDGPLCSVPGQPPYAGLTGEASAGVESVGGYGIVLPPLDVRARMADGWVRVVPLEGELSGGRFRLDPAVRLSPAEVHFPPGPVLTRVGLNRTSGDGLLVYPIPLLKGAFDVGGQVSFALDGAGAPLANPKAGVLSGKLTVHSLHLRSGPLVQELATILNVPPEVTLSREVVVPVSYTNGRVFHQGMEMQFQGVTVRTSGSVGLDGSLSLLAEIPIPAKWLPANRPAVAEALRKQPIRLPIGGTLDKPRPDPAAWKQEMARFGREGGRELLEAGAEKALERLFRPRQ